jgi:hypothetical protein
MHQSLEHCGKGGGQSCNWIGMLQTAGLLSHEGPVKESWHNLMKGRGNKFVLILLSLLWWMMREKDKMWVLVECSVAFEDVEWAL